MPKALECQHLEIELQIEKTGRFTMKKERMILVPAAILMTAMLAFPAMASEKIEEVTIDINAVLTDSDNLEVEADVSDDGCYVDEVTVTNTAERRLERQHEAEGKSYDRRGERIYVSPPDSVRSDVYLGNDDQTVTSVTRSTSKLYVYVTLPKIEDIDTDYDDEMMIWKYMIFPGMTATAELHIGKDLITQRNIRFVYTGTGQRSGSTYTTNE